MKRRLFATLAASSLVLCLAVLVTWVRSYRYHEFIAYLTTDRRPNGDRFSDQWIVASRVGVIYFGRSQWTMPAWATVPGDPEIKTGFRRFSQRAEPAPFDGGFNTVRWRFGRLVWIDETLVQGNWSRTRYLTVPAWVLAALFVMTPAYYLLVLVRRLRAPTSGKCRVCNYDLRATPHRCPECGELVPDRDRRTNHPTSDAPPEPNPHDPIRNAIERGDPTELRRLIADRPDLAGPVTSDDALLHVAWQHNRPLIPHLLDLGINSDQRDTLGGTVLMYAAAEDDPDLVALLLARGADANARNEAGETAFSYACTNDSFAAARRLHAAGADVNNIDAAAGASPLDWSVGHASADFHDWLLSIGCRPHADHPTPDAPANPPRSS